MRHSVHGDGLPDRRHACDCYLSPGHTSSRRSNVQARARLYPFRRSKNTARIRTSASGEIDLGSAAFASSIRTNKIGSARSPSDRLAAVTGERRDPMNPTLWHRLTNLLHSALLIGGMAAIVWACVSAIRGAESALRAFLAVGLFLLMTPSLPSALALTLYCARPIRPQDFGEGAAILQTLAGRANLERMPGFFCLPSSVPNAFATGHGSGTAIAISDGLLRLLDKRQLAAVLAHEVSHIAHRDLWIMALADVMARVTSVASHVGQILLILNLPSLLTNSLHIPWHVPLLLAFSPTLMSLLQLALSRAREYDADPGPRDSQATLRRLPRRWRSSTTPRASSGKKSSCRDGGSRNRPCYAHIRRPKIESGGSEPSSPRPFGSQDRQCSRRSPPAGHGLSPDPAGDAPGSGTKPYCNCLSVPPRNWDILSIYE